MKNKRLGLYIRLSIEDKQKIDALKSKHSINISQMIKNHISELFGRLENEQKTK